MIIGRRAVRTFSIALIVIGAQSAWAQTADQTKPRAQPSRSPSAASMPDAQDERRKTSTRSGTDYPNRPVRMITAESGATVDLVSRSVAATLSKRPGQSV